MRREREAFEIDRSNESNVPFYIYASAMPAGINSWLYVFVRDARARPAFPAILERKEKQGG